jgi:hypothetical protein
MKNSSTMAKDIRWERGRQIKEIHGEILELKKDMKDILEIKATLNQLKGMFTTMLAKEKQSLGLHQRRY